MKKKIILSVSAFLFTAIMVSLLAVTFFNISRNSTLEGNAQEEEEKMENNEMRGTWIASIGNINYPSNKTLTDKQMKAEIDAILDSCEEIGFNTVFFQVRPCGDALYESEIFPWSEYVSGEQGIAPDGSFDSLDYIIKEGKKRGIAVHAWVNPFRITNGSAAKPKTDVEALSENNPARIHPEYTVAYADGKLYYNPGLPEVCELVISGIREICEKYPDVAGIHIDDYFYPYPSGNAEFDDDEAYEEYGNGMARDDWRRANVSAFVKGAYDAVKAVNKDMKFGVSPFGIWANKGSDTYIQGSETNGLESYKVLYCDAIEWARGGYVDYLVPQIYWSFTTKAAPFDAVARWWNANLDGTGVDFYIGHAAYKAGDFGGEEYPRQIAFARALLTYRGSVFYGFEDVKKNTSGIKDALIREFSTPIWYEEPMSNGQTPEITYPTEDETTDDATNVFGTSDPAYPVEIEGNNVSRTKDGYFSYYTALDNGRNVISITSKDETVGFVINKVQSYSSASEMKKHEILSVYPERETWLSVGDTLTVSCTAPAGSTVSAKLGGAVIPMKPTKYTANTARNYVETYTGSLKIPTSFAKDRETADIGTLTFTAIKNGKSASKVGAQVKQLGRGALIYAQVKNDYSYLKRAPSSSFYGDPTPASIGMRDYVTGYLDGFYKLSCGYYISEENVDIVKDSALYSNKILSVNVESVAENTSNNSKNYTDVRFATLDNVPVNVATLKDKLTITFFNTDTAFLPKAEISKNPMVKSVSSSIVDGNVTYVITLVSAENYYGFNTVYEDGMIIFRLNNPQSLEAGEMPLYGKTIIIDPGHGGTDGGAPGPASIGSHLTESDLNLSITLELREILCDLGANVLMTRDNDTTLDLYSRIDILASMIPDMAISVHHNSVPNLSNAQNARGYLGLYSDCAGITLANAVADTVTNQLSRELRPTSYQMLAVARNHRYPTTLCEMNFICNIEEFQWSITEGNYKRSAEALANGILEFYRRQEKYLEY